MYTSGTQELQGRTVNHDPEPWALWQYNGNDVRFARPSDFMPITQGFRCDPRPEYAVHDNPILAGLREDGAEHAIMWLTTLEDQVEQGSTPEELEHARRVLEKLVALARTPAE